jgi:hypothetical protein
MASKLPVDQAGAVIERLTGVELPRSTLDHEARRQGQCPATGEEADPTHTPTCGKGNLETASGLRKQRPFFYSGKSSPASFRETVNDFAAPTRSDGATAQRAGSKWSRGSERVNQIKKPGRRVGLPDARSGVSHSTCFQFPTVTDLVLVLSSIHKSNLPGLLVGAVDT